MGKKRNYFEVEKVYGIKRTLGNIFYKVKWKGYPLSEATWEPRDHLVNCENLISEFLIRNNQRHKIFNSPIMKQIAPVPDLTKKKYFLIYF